MGAEFEAIKNKMAQLQAKRAGVLSLVDTLSQGEKGYRENERLCNRAERIQREIMRLNRKLFHLAGR